MMGLNAVDSMGHAAGCFLGLLLRGQVCLLPIFNPMILGGVEKVEIRERI